MNCGDNVTSAVLLGWELAFHMGSLHQPGREIAQIILIFMPTFRDKLGSFVEAHASVGTDYQQLLREAKVAPLRFVAVRFGSPADGPSDGEWFVFSPQAPDIARKLCACLILACLILVAWL